MALYRCIDLTPSRFDVLYLQSPFPRPQIILSTIKIDFMIERLSAYTLGRCIPLAFSGALEMHLLLTSVSDAYSAYSLRPSQERPRISLFEDHQVPCTHLALLVFHFSSMCVPLSYTRGAFIIILFIIDFYRIFVSL